MNEFDADLAALLRSIRPHHGFADTTSQALGAGQDSGNRRPAGPMESAFRRVCDLYAGKVRGVTVALVSVFGVVATPPGTFGTGLWLALAAVTVAAVDLLGGTSPGCRRVRLQLAVGLAVAICLLRPTVAGGAGGFEAWSFNVVTVTAITLQWEWRPLVSVPAAALLVSLLWATSGVFSGDVPAILVIRPPVECALALIAFGLVVRSARGLDRMRAERIALEREMALDTARRAKQRENLALLHDTAASTLQMAAQSPPVLSADQLAYSARRDLGLLTGRAWPWAESGELVDFTALVGSIAEQSPLEVCWQVEGDPSLPVGPALAISLALREVLTNAHRHAGVREVCVHVEGSSSGVVVQIRDTGVGFDPASVPVHSRGILESVVQRLAVAGGKAEVTSTPGKGTQVRLAWPDV